MRKLMLVIAIFGLVGSLFAVDPSVGTWKLNLAKSKYPSSVTPPKEQMLVKKELGPDQFEMVLTGVDATGNPISVKLTHSQKGGIVSGMQDGAMVILTVLAPGNVVTTFIESGKQVRVHHNTVSKNGKTMTQTSKYVDEKGQQTEVVEVWNRQ